MNSHIIETLKKEIAKTKLDTQLEKVGQVIKISDGVATLSGLTDAMSGELLEFPGKIFGVALNLEEDSVGAMILGDYLKIKEGDTVKSTGRILEVPVGKNMIGRVVNALGQAIDGKGEIKSDKFYPVEKTAPGVIKRKSVNTPLQTGIKAIDSMIPIGRGQRELIIGDRQTGKTAIAIDTIINQKGKDVICIYVAIGQKGSKIAKIVAKLEESGAMDHTVVVLASASDPASMSFIAPYAGCAIGEYFMDQGKDAMIIYDDLSKHAWAYRQVSLILRRPPGREAYPGDIFYLHSRLLERACNLSTKRGGGSLTAFPIIETQAGDLSGYIPTNVISITDGQIFLEGDLFYAGIRPAINVGLSVSRVGGSAQVPAMKKVAGRLKLDLAQYRALSAFVQFATDLDPKTRDQIDQGAKMVELLKQPQFDPVPVEEQIAIIWAGTSGILKDVSVGLMIRFEKDYRDYLRKHAGGILTKLKNEGKMTDEISNKLKVATEKFLELWPVLKESKQE